MNKQAKQKVIIIQVSQYLYQTGQERKFSLLELLLSNALTHGTSAADAAGNHL